LLAFEALLPIYRLSSLSDILLIIVLQRRPRSLPLASKEIFLAIAFLAFFEVPSERKIVLVAHYVLKLFLFRVFRKRLVLANLLA
jgi:hypothetical protein